VPPGDPAALAHAIYNLVSDKLRREELGKRGRQAVHEAFTDEHMAANMLKVYRGVIG
jgi:glycosyltransferase involved in cell wall biosynthesis